MKSAIIIVLCSTRSSTQFTLRRGSTYARRVPKTLFGNRVKPEIEPPNFVEIGKTIDTIKADLPLIFEDSAPRPDLSVFADNIQLSDPTGIKLEGRQSYSEMYSSLRIMSRCLFRNSSTRVRFFYDEGRGVLKGKFTSHVRLVKWIPYNRDADIYISIVSLYHINLSSGKVSRHHVDRVDFNGKEMEPLEVLRLTELARLGKARPVRGIATYTFSSELASVDGT